MNKKHIVTLGLLLAASAGSTYAQKSKIKEANNAYDKAREALILGNKPEAEKLLLKAKAAADEAVANAETATNAGAWMAKAVTYISLSQIESYQAGKTYKTGYEAFQKAITLDPKIEGKTDGIDNVLQNAGIFAFNDGINDFNKSNYDAAISAFDIVKGSFGHKNGEYIKANKAFDTVLAQSNMYSAYSSYYSKKYDEAIPKLEAAIANPITTSSVDIYRVAAMSYGEQKNTAKQLALIESAKKKFPGNKDIAADELNYYVVQGKEDLLTKKFEEAVVQDPNNAQFVSNLGILYRNMAMGKEGKVPENAEELYKKSETSLKKAVQLESGNAIYQYQLGNMFVQKADYIATKMNALGSTKADNLKYDGFVTLRNSYLKEALAPFEAAERILEPKQKENKISTEEKGYFLETLQAVGKIHAALNNPEKSAEYKTKLKTYE
ncbi:hypothetical protein DBR32_14315 [Taibaiella sp. KBW10]|uniref:tetratricopeptide repeat protein n=1 Tax=Taibaiella sp. KBW10 TaxID=2153357 RepID=UPI000F59FA10|nr:hypothetical protein [Taibaiella sp. KBW10]RQO29756.1 hypothetical protein DBR32_14315 [Taibaiella sp. KBW10]